VALPGARVPGLAEPLRYLAFADDVVLQAETAQDSIEALRLFKEWAQQNGMTPNASKSAIMLIRPEASTVRTDRLSAGNHFGEYRQILQRRFEADFNMTFPLKRSYKYVGVELLDSWDLDKMMKPIVDRVNRTRGRMTPLLTNKSLPTDFKYHAIKTFLMPVATYAGALLGMHRGRSAKLQRPINEALRLATGLGMRTTCCTATLLSQAHIAPLYATLSAAKLRLFRVAASAPPTCAGFLRELVHTPAAELKGGWVHKVRVWSKNYSGMEGLRTDEKLDAWRDSMAGPLRMHTALRRRMWRKEGAKQGTQSQAFYVRHGLWRTRKDTKYAYDLSVFSVQQVIRARIGWASFAHRQAYTGRLAEEYTRKCPTCSQPRKETLAHWFVGVHGIRVGTRLAPADGRTSSGGKSTRSNEREAGRAVPGRLDPRRDGPKLQGGAEEGRWRPETRPDAVLDRLCRQVPPSRQPHTGQPPTGQVHSGPALETISGAANGATRHAPGRGHGVRGRGPRIANERPDPLPAYNGAADPGETSDAHAVDHQHPQRAPVARHQEGLRTQWRAPTPSSQGARQWTTTNGPTKAGTWRWCGESHTGTTTRKRGTRNARYARTSLRRRRRPGAWATPSTTPAGPHWYRAATSRKRSRTSSSRHTKSGRTIRWPSSCGASTTTTQSARAHSPYEVGTRHFQLDHIQTHEEADINEWHDWTPYGLVFTRNEQHAVAVRFQTESKTTEQGGVEVTQHKITGGHLIESFPRYPVLALTTDQIRAIAWYGRIIPGHSTHLLRSRRHNPI